VTKSARVPVLTLLGVAIQFTASAASQTITFDAIPDQLYGVSPFVIAAQASSGLPVTFTSATPAVCKTSGSLVMLLSVGACSLTASQGGNGVYSAATPVTRSFTVSQAKPSGTLTQATGSPFAVDSYPQSVVVADFNGDGIPDLATANSSSSVSILLGNGLGGFTEAPGSPAAAGSDPSRSRRETLTAMDSRI
jgi:hypothetical protein